MKDTRHDKTRRERARCFECGAVLHASERDYCRVCVAGYLKAGRLVPLNGPPTDTPIGAAYHEMRRAIVAAGSVEAFTLDREPATADARALFVTLGELRAQLLPLPRK